MIDETPISDEQAWAARPKVLPEVELELRGGPPRPTPWTFGRLEPLSTEELALLSTGEANRAWVVRSQPSWSSGYEDGPRYDADYAFASGKRLVRARFAAAYDAAHLVYGAPAYAAWLAQAFDPGATFTVICQADRPEEHRIFGCLQPYLRRSVLELVAAVRDTTDGPERDRLLGAVQEVVLSPSNLRGEQARKYVALLAELGLRTKRGMRSPRRTLSILRAGLSTEAYAPALLARLSDFCARFGTGLWAAS